MAAYSFSCSNCGYVEDILTRVSYDVHMRMKLFNRELSWDDPKVIENMKHRSDYYTSDDYFQSSIDEWWDNGCPGCCLLYTSPSPRDRQKSRMPSSA